MALTEQNQSPHVGTEVHKIVTFIKRILIGRLAKENNLRLASCADPTHAARVYDFCQRLCQWFGSLLKSDPFSVCWGTLKKCPNNTFLF